MLSKRKRAIGLSIGQSKIAVAEVNVDSEGDLEVSLTGSVNTPEGVVENGMITNPTVVSRAIRLLLSEKYIDAAKEASLAVPDEGSVTRFQTLPSMARGETLEALRGEVENYAVLAGGEPVIDFQVSKGSPDAVGQQMEVLYVATTDDLVNSYLSTMEAASLRHLSMETRPLAIFRAFSNLLNRAEGISLPELGVGKPVALAIIEENAGMIIIARNENIEFIHDIEIESRNIQTDMALRELAHELRSSVDYYHNNLSPEEKIENVILFSDSDDLANIAEKLEGYLRLPVKVTSLSEAAATGAAIRVIRKENEADINLLLTSKGAEARSSKKRVLMLLAIFLSAAFLTLGARFLFKMQADSVEAELITLQERQAINEAQASQQIPLLQLGIQSLISQIEVTNAAMNSITWGDQANLLEEIRRLIPKDVWLSNLRWSGDTVTFEGFGLSWDAVFKFKRALLDSSLYFDPVELDYIRETPIGGHGFKRFQIHCQVKREKLGGGVTQG